MEPKERTILRRISYFLFAVSVILLLISIWGSAEYSDQMVGTALLSMLVGVGFFGRAEF